MRGPSEPHPALGAAIRRTRERSGSTQEDLAEAAGLHVTTLGRIERGDVDTLWASVRSIASALEVHPSVLVLLAEEIDRQE